MTLRALHVIPALDAATGGPPIVAARLAAALAAMGLEMTLATYDWPGRERATAALLAGVPGLERVRLASIPVPGRLERFTAAAAKRALAPLVASADVVHAHGVWDPIVAAACAAARRAGRPYVITPHGMLDPWSLAQGRMKKHLALWLGYGRMLRQAALLHCLNRDEERLIAPLRLGGRRVVIGNGIFPEEFAALPPAGTFRPRVPKLGDAPFALFLSRLHYKKGLDVLADAMRLLADRESPLQLVVAGPDDGERAAFERSVAAHGLQSRVHLVGPLYGPDKLAALVDAAMFVLISRQEGFSIAVTEALACARPVVISDACHFPEVAEERCGHVVPVDARATANAIAELLSRPADAAAMGQRGRQMVLARFTWPQVARQMAEAYRDLAPGK